VLTKVATATQALEVADRVIAASSYGTNVVDMKLLGCTTAPALMPVPLQNEPAEPLRNGLSLPGTPPRSPIRAPYFTRDESLVFRGEIGHDVLDSQHGLGALPHAFPPSGGATLGRSWSRTGPLTG
jgi:hypothetical protein